MGVTVSSQQLLFEDGATLMAVYPAALLACLLCEGTLPGQFKLQQCVWERKLTFIRLPLCTRHCRQFVNQLTLTLNLAVGITPFMEVGLGPFGHYFTSDPRSQWGG